MIQKCPVLCFALTLLCGCQSPFPMQQQKASGHYGNAPLYHVKGKTYRILASADGYDKRGIASWYGPQFHGKLTSTRERYDMYAMTAASPELPLPTRVRVTNLSNGRSVVVRVNDRGPFHANRIIDLSYAAAKELRMIGPGTARVEVTALKRQPAATNVTRHAAIYWQTGTFAEHTNAVRQQAWLQREFPQRQARVQRITTDHGIRFRVSVGPEQSLDGAQHLRAQLAARGISDTIACP